MIRLLLIPVLLIALWQRPVAAQATQPAEDAATLYLRAAKLVGESYSANIMSPAASNLEDSGATYPAEWQRMEEADFPANAMARTLAHQARSIDQAHWPARPILNLNSVRMLGNELADAAVFQHIRHHDAAAIETLRDQWHLADLVANPSDKRDRTIVGYLVSIGIRAESDRST